MDKKIAGLRVWAWGAIALAAAVGLYLYTQRKPKGYTAEQSPLGSGGPGQHDEGTGSATVGALAGLQLPPIIPAQSGPELGPAIEPAPAYEPAPGPEPRDYPLVVAQFAQPTLPAPNPAEAWINPGIVTAAQVEAAGHPLVLSQRSQEGYPGEAGVSVLAQFPQASTAAPVVVNPGGSPQPTGTPAPSYPAAEAVVSSYFPGGPAEHAAWVKAHSGPAGAVH